MIFRRRNREDRRDGKAKRPFLLLVPFLLTIWLLSILPGLQPAQLVTADNGTTITLESAVTEINGCETLDLYIRINDVANLYGADVRLAFDPTVLQVVALQELDGILQSPYYIASQEFDNTAGTLWLALTQLNPTSPVTGTGDFARVTFRAAGLATDSTVMISYSKLSNPNGVEIPAARIDGSLTTIAPPAPAVAIEILNPTTPRLSWTAVSGVDGYNIYRDTYAYFTPDLPYATVTTPVYDDDDALGDIADNHFYVIRSACDTGFESAISNRVGEFDYELVVGILPQRSNLIAIPLDSTTLISPFKASGLVSYVGSGVKQVSKWNSSTQSFDTFIPVISPPAQDFDLTIGGGYLLVVDDSPETTLTFVGQVPPIGSVIFNLTPGTTSSCTFNKISIPLDLVSITKASELASDIGGVVQVLAWDPQQQNFRTFVPGLSPPTLDFTTRTGYSYFVCLADTAPVSWP